MSTELGQIHLALGYGETPGSGHKVKPVSSLCRVPGGPAAMPEWFSAGVRAAQLAPTAMNQQAFSFELVEGEVPGVRARPGLGPCARIDLGIARCHFEIGARTVSTGWRWVRR
ncbi:nitroreductase family protein [Collinsella tanakaei]|uniref:nitroreductase family protein n=1 Tax=Collinsella tanakaei TaxID=626935 RepID=UPI00195AAF0F